MLTTGEIDEASMRLLQLTWDRFVDRVEWPLTRSLELALEDELTGRESVQAWCGELGPEVVNCESPLTDTGRCTLRMRGWARCIGSERYSEIVVQLARAAATLYRAADGQPVKFDDRQMEALKMTELEKRVLSRLVQNDCHFLAGGTFGEWQVGRFAGKLRDVRDINDYVQRLDDYETRERTYSRSPVGPSPKLQKSARLFATASTSYARGEKLGEGGVGTVFEVHSEANELFAIKVLDASKANSEKRKRFQNELMFGIRNRHKSILTLLDFGVVVGGEDLRTPFYVMRRYPGTLRTLMRAGIRFDDTLALILQLLDGVEAAHLQGIWHRDLKPENVLVAPESSELVVADWGCAHFAEEELHTLVKTSPAARLANFQYAAPEQRKPGVPVDHRADIFALGLIMNEIYTGDVPQGTSHKVVGDVSPPHAFLDEIINMMITQDPGGRPQTIGEVKQRIAVLGKAATSRQRLDQLEQTVVSSAVSDDPLIRDPIRVVGGDYRDGMIFLSLNRVPSSAWQSAFGRIHFQTAIWNKEPSTFRFTGAVAHNSIDPGQAQSLVNDFKRFVGLANDLYARETQRRLRQEEETERERIRGAIESEKQRQELLGKLQF